MTVITVIWMSHSHHPAILGVRHHPVESHHTFGFFYSVIIQLLHLSHTNMLITTKPYVLKVILIIILRNIVYKHVCLQFSQLQESAIEHKVTIKKFQSVQVDCDRLCTMPIKDKTTYLKVSRSLFSPPCNRETEETKPAI